MNRKTRQFGLDFVLISLLIILLLYSASALTATLGNSRMILRMNTGESIEKYLLIKNTNSVSVKIEMTASGDLEKSVKIKDSSFTLSPNEEKNAFFTIKATKSGTTETRLNVRFIPEEGNAVGLSAAIIVIASGSDIDQDLEDESDDGSNSQDTEDNSNDKTDLNENDEDKKDRVLKDLENNKIINFAENKKEDSDISSNLASRVVSSTKESRAFIPKMLIFSTVTLIVLLVLLVVYSNKFRRKKRLKGGHA